MRIWVFGPPKTNRTYPPYSAQVSVLPLDKLLVHCEIPLVSVLKEVQSTKPGVGKNYYTGVELLDPSIPQNLSR